MNSRISIDVNEDNKPIIRVDYRQSGDVRDKLVQRFLEGLISSSWCKIRYIGDSLEEQVLEIKPVSISSLEAEAKEMTDWAEHCK